jgi:hypothetical protein
LDNISYKYNKIKYLDLHLSIYISNFIFIVNDFYFLFININSSQFILHKFFNIYLVFLKYIYISEKPAYLIQWTGQIVNGYIYIYIYIYEKL